MANIHFFNCINQFGSEERLNAVRPVSEGDWLIAGPPWEFRNETERKALWDLLNLCFTEEEFLARAKKLEHNGFPVATDRGERFLRWLKRNWWMVRATRT